MACSNKPIVVNTECTEIENPGPLLKIEIDEKEKLVYVQHRHKTELEPYGHLLAGKKEYVPTGLYIQVLVMMISENKYLNGKMCVLSGFFTYTGFVRESSIEMQ